MTALTSAIAPSSSKFWPLSTAKAPRGGTNCQLKANVAAMPHSKAGAAGSQSEASVLLNTSNRVRLTRSM